MYHRDSLCGESFNMTVLLAVSILEVGFGSLTTYFKISKRHHKSMHRRALKLAFAVYFLYGLGWPNITTISDTVTINLQASIRKYEFKYSKSESEFSLDFKIGASVPNELSKKWRKKRDSNPR